MSERNDGSMTIAAPTTSAGQPSTPTRRGDGRSGERSDGEVSDVPSDSEWSTEGSDDDESRHSSHSLPSLQSISDSSDSDILESDETYSESMEEEEEIDEESSYPPPFPDIHQPALRTLDLIELLLTSAPNQQLDNDPLRARTLLAGLEAVSDDLVRRYEVLKRGCGDDSDGCVICRDDLLPSSPPPLSPEAKALAVVELFSALPFQPPLEIILAFPCPGKHLFHHDCLAPWLARKTTCPTCRFDIDPHSLTLRKSTTHRRTNGPTPRSSPERVWEPPRASGLREWLEREEYYREHGVRKDMPPDVVSMQDPLGALADDEMDPDEDEWVDTDNSDDPDTTPSLLPTDRLRWRSDGSTRYSRQQMTDALLMAAARFDVLPSPVRLGLSPLETLGTQSDTGSRFDIRTADLASAVPNGGPHTFGPWGTDFRPSGGH